MEHFVWFACFAGGVLVGCGILRLTMGLLIGLTGMADEGSDLGGAVLIVLAVVYLATFSLHSPWGPALDGFVRGIPVAPLVAMNALALYMWIGKLVNYGGG